MLKIVPALFLLLVSCAGDSAKSPQPVSDTPIVQPEEATAVEVEAEAEETPTTEPPADTCVADCVASRQMQATSIEQIEADCQAQCDGDESKTLD